MAHKNHGITLWPRKIKKCDPKRLEVTRHARHDKTFICCYFLRHYTKKKNNWWNSPTHRGVMRSGSVCGDVVPLCLIRCVPALTYWRDLIRSIHAASSQAANGLGLSDCVILSLCICVYVCVCSAASAMMKGPRSGRKLLWSQIINIWCGFTIRKGGYYHT